VRRRIVLTSVAVSAITLLAFSVFSVLLGASRAVRTEVTLARTDANRIASAIDSRLKEGVPFDRVNLNDLVRSDSAVDVRLTDGRTVFLGVKRGDQLTDATSTEPGPAVVTVHVRGSDFRQAAFRIGGVFFLAGLVAIAVAALVGRRLANGLVEPVGDLALVAARLGSGDPRPSRRRYGIAELDAVAEVLDASATRIGEQLEAERQLAGNVSHQLRTPLTAVSMRLEEVIATDDPAVARSEAVVALQQVERLSGVVDDLLAFSRHTRGAQADVSVDQVLSQQFEEWRSAYSVAGRELRVEGEAGLVTRVTASSFGQIVATLIENALVHGAGTTTVRTRTSGGSVVVEVTDQGPGVRPELARRIFERDVSGSSGSGLGLAVARALTEVEGGRLELIAVRPATFALFLPRPPAAVDADAADAGDAAAQPTTAPA
jgi:signal transduction histidine kinase